MRTTLRFLQLLSMVVWVGGLIFFAFALAPTAFHVLPVRQAGLVVGGVLRVFHPVGLACGVVFLLAGVGLLHGAGRTLTQAGMGLCGIMLLVTAYLQLSVLPAMERDQVRAGGDVNAAAPADPARIDFNRLHILSERAESVVLLCGLAAVGTLAAERGRAG